MLDQYYAFKFIRLLTQEWTATDAYKLGIIDDKGNLIRKPFSDKEKQSYSRFNQLVWNIRRLLEKLPFGSSSLGRYATALALLREEICNKVCNKNVLTETFLKHMEMESINNIEFELQENMAGGIDIIDRPLAAPHNPAHDDVFAGSIVFNCSPDVFHKSRFGKTKYGRYKSYVADDEVGLKIKEYGRKYPKKKIILKNHADGSMLYLRK